MINVSEIDSESLQVNTPEQLAKSFYVCYLELKKNRSQNYHVDLCVKYMAKAYKELFIAYIENEGLKIKRHNMNFYVKEYFEDINLLIDWFKDKIDNKLKTYENEEELG